MKTFRVLTYRKLPDMRMHKKLVKLLVMRNMGLSQPYILKSMQGTPMYALRMKVPRYTEPWYLQAPAPAPRLWSAQKAAKRAKRSWAESEWVDIPLILAAFFVGTAFVGCSVIIAILVAGTF